MQKHDLDAEYEFRTVEPSDLALVGRWIHQPHWPKWRGDPADELARIGASIDSISVEPLLVELDGEPVAYLESYDPHLEDDHPYADQPFGTLGIALILGTEDLQKAGHYAAILEQFVQELFDEGALRVIIDPPASNVQEIRACEKAGFRALGERNNDYGPVLLMACDNPEDGV